MATHKKNKRNTGPVPLPIPHPGTGTPGPMDKYALAMVERAMEAKRLANSPQYPKVLGMMLDNTKAFHDLAHKALVDFIEHGGCSEVVNTAMKLYVSTTEGYLRLAGTMRTTAEERKTISTFGSRSLLIAHLGVQVEQLKSYKGLILSDWVTPPAETPKDVAVNMRENGRTVSSNRAMKFTALVSTYHDVVRDLFESLDLPLPEKSKDGKTGAADEKHEEPPIVDQVTSEPPPQ